MQPEKTMQIRVTENGPYLVSGSVPIARQTIVADGDGNSVGWREGQSYETKASCALCRCGQSANKPFCDGSHARVGFQGAETASREPYCGRPTIQEGPSLLLTDAVPLCAFARFCDVAGQVWNLVEQARPGSGHAWTAQEAGLCPSGRLVAWDRETRPTPRARFERSIGIVEDPAEGVAGPLWVRGGIPVVAADGEPYEVRNRVTLCRCGASKNKPFCDASHASIGFTD